METGQTGYHQSAGNHDANLLQTYKGFKAQLIEAKVRYYYLRQYVLNDPTYNEFLQLRKDIEKAEAWLKNV
jgi:hypothetical protein